MPIHRLWLLLPVLLIVSSCSLFRSTAVADPEDEDLPEGVVEVGEPAPATKYYEIITDDADSEEGLFTVHKVEDKLYFEIPDAELGRDLLMVSRIVRAQAGTGYGGMRINNYVLRWEKQGERILLRHVMH